MVCHVPSDLGHIQEPAGGGPNCERTPEDAVRQLAGAEPVSPHRALLEGAGAARGQPHQAAHGTCAHSCSKIHEWYKFWDWTENGIYQLFSSRAFRKFQNFKCSKHLPFYALDCIDFVPFLTFSREACPWTLLAMLAALVQEIFFFK